MAYRNSKQFSLLQLLTVFLCVLTLSGCVTSVHKGQHEQLESSLQSKNTHQLLVTSADVQIFELGVSDSEEVPEWTETGTRLVNAAVNKEFGAFDRFHMIDKPALTDEEENLLEQYTQLYYPVVDSEIIRSRFPAWKHDELKTKTTLGPGLAFLKNKYKVDYAVFVSGQDYISTGGRKAAMIAAALFGVGIPMGFSYLTVGIVETETGNVVWNNFVFSQEVGFLEEEQVSQAVTKALETLPAESVGKTVVQLAEK
ncbi:hypothetical protein [Neptuniibacter sp. QD34_54]|uniref:hypothetical protein n=1 Tax=Neptuniibacter sp. QD34_54 TaxID=3398208 RepID=UPI0039F49A32